MPGLLFEPVTFEGYSVLEQSIPMIDPLFFEVIHVNGNYPFGHVLLGINRQFFFHVSGLNSYPKFLTSLGWQQYVKENGKRIFKVESVAVPHPEEMMLKLKETMSEPWDFRTNHNCTHFVQEILAAGGARWELITGIPIIGKNDLLPKIPRV